MLHCRSPREKDPPVDQLTDTSLLFNQPSPNFIYPRSNRITCNDTKVVVVEYHKLQNVEMLIGVKVRVPWIRHVTDSCVGLIVLGSSR